MRQSQSRSGFTLYHLLVILAILAVLLAFLFPAVQKVREAARRSQSVNNLKQIMLAGHSYSDVNGHFPSGNNEQNFSAFVHLLPYVEQNNLYMLIDQKKSVEDKANAQVRGTVVITFVSPLDGRQRVVNDLGPTSYLFNAGTKASLEKNNGVFYYKSELPLAKIRDGLSNTVAVVETLMGDGKTKAVDLRRQHVELKAEALKGLKEDTGVDEWKNNKNIVGTRGASWMDGRFLQSTMNAGRKPSSDKPDVSCGGLGGWAGPRSNKNFFQVGMCDGSVRTIRDTVSFQTWQRAMDANDGMALGNDF